jgi:hypothetical protein
MRKEQIQSEIDSLVRRINRKRELAEDKSTSTEQKTNFFREAKELEAQCESMRKRLKLVPTVRPSTSRMVTVTTRRLRTMDGH